MADLQTVAERFANITIEKPDELPSIYKKAKGYWKEPAAKAWVLGAAVAHIAALGGAPLMVRPLMKLLQARGSSWETALCNAGHHGNHDLIHQLMAQRLDALYAGDNKAVGEFMLAVYNQPTHDARCFLLEMVSAPLAVGKAA